jgi:hypothetical protein
MNTHQAISTKTSGWRWERGQELQWGNFKVWSNMAEVVFVEGVDF